MDIITHLEQMKDNQLGKICQGWTKNKESKQVTDTTHFLEGASYKNSFFD
jgi:hypothetical protein